METLALIEMLDRDGQPRHAIRVTHWPVRIGRAIDCDVVLDDPHVAPHHATLDWREGVVRVEPEPTVNGVRVGRARLASGGSAGLPPSSTIVLGTTTLRVRLAGELLAPEEPLRDIHLGTGRRAAGLLGLLLVAALWAGFNQWLLSTPGSSGAEMTGLYLALPIGLGVWCGLWALGSKLFQRQFAFWPHLQAALFWPLVASLVQSASAQAAFAFSMPWMAKAGHVLAVSALAMLLWRHLGIVLPQRRRAFAWVIAGVLIAGGGLDVAERARHQQPLVGSLYLGTISVPGLRLASPTSADAFVKSAQPLEKSLGRWARSNADDGDADAADEAAEDADN